MTEMTFGQMFQLGGVVMWVLLAASVLMWTIGLERLVQIFRVSRFLDSWDQAIELGLTREKYLALTQTAPRSMAKLLSLVADPQGNEKIRERRLHEFLTQTRRNLWVLGTIASATPFVGLYGTVVGIMRSFHQMGLAGTGGFNVVAAGISQALIATAGGLIVAIIALMLYNFFSSKSNELISRTRIAAEDTADALGRSPGRA